MKPFRLLRRAIALSSLGVASGALIVTTRHLMETPQPLESALPGEGHVDRRPEGQMYYDVAGPAGADALVLLHDFYPGASNFEFRRVFGRLAETHRVYAPDWLGFGMSERPALAYTGEFYAHLLREFLRGAVERPAVVLAHGLAGNVAVRAASDEPALFERLVLVAPRASAGTAEAPTWGQTAVRLAQRSFLGLVPYAALTTRTALRWQLQHRAASAGEGAATDDAVDHVYASAHQFGAEFAPLALLTGELELAVPNALALLEPPVLIVAGERDSLQPLAELEHLVLVNHHAQFASIPNAGDAIYEDAPDAFVDRLNLWLGTERGRRTTRLADVMHPGPMAASGVRERPLAQGAAAATAPGASLHGGIVSPEEAAAQSARESGSAAAMDTTTEEEAGEGEEDVLPLDEAANADHRPTPDGPRFDATPPTSEMIGTRGDIRAEAAPPELARELEAPNAATKASALSTRPEAAAAEAGDTLREAMSAPEAPVPTTLAAMTAPLDAEAPRPEEGAIEPRTGPHPVPADERETDRVEEQASRHEIAGADTAIAANEAARLARGEQTAQMQATARVQAEAEGRVTEEAERLDERIQSAGPVSSREGAAAGEEPTMETAPEPASGAETGDASAARSPAEKAGRRTGDGKTKNSHGASVSPPRAAAGPSRAASGESRQAPGRGGTRPAPAKGGQRASGGESPAPGQSGGHSGGSKRQNARKSKHSHH